MSRKTKVHKVTLLIVDHDNVGADGVVDVLENAHYPNRCIGPDVLHVETREVEWHDRHPLNITATSPGEREDIFASLPEDKS